MAEKKELVGLSMICVSARLSDRSKVLEKNQKFWKKINSSKNAPIAFEPKNPITLML